jgi:hypothetical protein
MSEAESPSFPAHLTIPGLDRIVRGETEGAKHTSYYAEGPVALRGFGSPIVTLTGPQYTQFEPESFVRHMAELWAELPGAIGRVRAPLQRRLARTISDFAHLDAAEGKRLAGLVCASLTVTEVCLHSLEDYWVLRRTPALLARHGALMTGLGLWVGEQCYQLQVDTRAIDDAVGGP